METWRFQANRNLFVLQLAKTESIITVQRGFQTKYHAEPLTDKTIREWYRKFEEMGCLCAAKRTGRPGPSPETVDRV
jgi:transposase